MAIEGLMAFVLVLVRVSCIMVFLPFLGGGTVPRVIKVAAALAVSMALFPAAAVHLPLNSWQPVEYVLFIAAEALFGALIGLSAAFIFSGMRVAGEVLGSQMGMGLAEAADPMSNEETSPLGTFCEVVGVLVFFAVNGHHMMLEAIGQSFANWPLGAFLSPGFFQTVTVDAAAGGLLLAVQLAAPLLVLMLLVSLIMALMARLVAEVNVLIISFPLRIGAGLVGLTLFVPTLVSAAGSVARQMGQCMSFVAGGG
jgi:flagellar biosynthetic protein FliR